jgi:hypothetical protein
MDAIIVEEFLKNYHNFEPYEVFYSIYLYSMFLLSTILTALLLRHVYGNSKLGKDVRCIILHFAWVCYGVTALMSNWQVRNMEVTKYMLLSDYLNSSSG